MPFDLFSELPNPLLARPFAVVDFETTGLYPAVGDEICEIGVVRLEAGEIVKEFSALVDPGRPLDPAASQVSGITQEMLAGQPPFEARADEFLALLADSVIVAHNAEFDMGFLQYKLTRMGRNQVGNPVLDTLELARAQDDAGPFTLGILANRLGIEGPHAHRALDDARMAARVLLHYLGEYHRRGQDDLARVPGYRTSYQFSIGGHGRGEENSFQLVVENIRRAIEIHVDLEIAYRGSGGQTRRRVTPMYIKGMNMHAYCHMRKEDRDFRLDRIVEVSEVAAKPKV
jgi:DNA polymerase III epsilon subunit family exonuclease